jgi:hypothetical protein
MQSKIRSRLGWGLIALLSCAVGAAAWTGTAFAGLDAEENEPYQLSIIVGFSNHPLLTQVFKDEVKREIQGSFEAALGSAGVVEVLDTDKLRESAAQQKNASAASPESSVALLDSVEANRLQEAFNGWRHISDRKVHCVFVDFKNDRYDISARQYDGFTALASPVVRRGNTYDRQFVGRIASLLIERDFGVVGTLGAAQGDQVDVTLKAGALIHTPEPFVKRGDVFAISQIRQAPNGQVGYQLKWTLLRATNDAKQGVCRCALIHRYKDPLPQAPSVLGYRCIKLGTGHGPLTLRLVDEKTRNPLANTTVSFSQSGFASKEQEHRPTDAAGLVKSRNEYQDLAFVSVSTRPVPALLPVEIIDNRPVTCLIDVSPEAQRVGELESARDHLFGRMGEWLLKLGGLFKELNELQKKARDEALETASTGRKELEAAVVSFEIEIAKLRSDGQPLGPDYVSKLLEPCERDLEQLRDRKKQLQDYTQRLRDAIREEQDPKRRKLQDLAATFIVKKEQGDYGAAIDLCEQIVREGKGQPGIASYVEDLATLKKQWALKGDDHKKAREFFYSRWPTLRSAAELKANTAEAKKALAVCIKAGDPLTPRMLLRANTNHFNRLAERLKAVADSDNPEERNEGKGILEVRTDLEELTKQASVFIQPAKESGK